MIYIIYCLFILILQNYFPIPFSLTEKNTIINKQLIALDKHQNKITYLLTILIYKFIYYT